MKQDIRLIPLSPALKDRRTAPDHIAEALREAILSGAFADHEELNQVALAEHFGVSRVPIREALRQLQAEGLVTVEAHRRAVVTGMTAEGLAEIFDIRSLLECYLIEKAIPEITDQTLKQLAEIIAKAERTQDRREWLRRNREIHRTLYEPSQAKAAIALVEQLAGRAERYLHLRSHGRGIDRFEEANAEHRLILRAVENGDAAQAKLELQMHIAHTRDRVVQLFAEMEESLKTEEAART